ncbi:MAG: hypothetical protein EZS28_049091, partial [Streblomastix strix]
MDKNSLVLDGVVYLQMLHHVLEEQPHPALGVITGLVNENTNRIDVTNSYPLLKDTQDKEAEDLYQTTNLLRLRNSNYEYLPM